MARTLRLFHLVSALIATALGTGAARAQSCVTFQAQPISRQVTVCPYADPPSVTFAVTASGPDPLEYHWRHDGTDLVDGGRIAGATTRTLTVAFVQYGDTGDYDVLVSAQCGFAMSEPAHLEVQESPCRRDINCDGAVNVGDFLRFLDLFAAGDMRVDYNQDGRLNILDFLAFINDFAGDC